ncbi:maltose alpha-D-glucosyltransferase [Tessaracoccus sp. OH4464_COT-324]|uniref:maltose alpha-D-glucosyltransferase n=1 Tax=Tessaracoccus sp. OH4464_COT-324 TaxID=2491059 RepID=UPI000F636557|nr:maltose alpha-D-glucosyltransferase [Tessaracoccus sp. OH4464_COT-324]RRD48013.1 maltose alpha-D-glucosyltransferase [Tessaracoccus sp. OH4464_COT-324]
MGPNETEEITAEPSFDQQRFAARPARLRPRARRAVSTVTEAPEFEADGRNEAYVEWLVGQSMLADATRLARQLAGNHLMWSNAFASPAPRNALDQAQVWFTAYPLSLITSPGQSFLGALGEDALWDAFERIGIDAIHTGPVKLAGGLKGLQSTPSIDGHFDRISMSIDPLFGSEDEFRSMCETAARFGGTIIDDIIPAHTGKGADFRLAELNYGDYPGIYHMVAIPEEAWHLLPEVPEGRDCVNLSPETERALAEAGYIIGELQRVIFYEPGVKETNWSATAPIPDVNGVAHRWVYLHYFKDGQPSINWLDPSCAGMRLVMGDILHSLLDLGTGGLRLDANGFLAVEKSVDLSPAWSEGHPLSQAANQLIGALVRKLGGFTFQELNLSFDEIAATGAVGPDLSYDFVSRPGYHLALATGDTEFLRLVLNESLALGIDQASLVHALQNHDELTYELVHFTSRHAEQLFQFDGLELSGAALADHVRATLRAVLTGPSVRYNRVFTQNGIACTTVSVITAALGISDFSAITDEDRERIIQAHLLLCMFNAYQPGVFALSGWDLVGALPLDAEQVAVLMVDGDTRWIERGAYDLLGSATEVEASSAGMPRAKALYGPLPDQLADPESFASRLARIIRVRRDNGLAFGTLVDVPSVTSRSMLVLVNRLPDLRTQVTALNFSPEPIDAYLRSDEIPPGRVTDLASGAELAEVDELGGFTLALPAFGGAALVIN